jgi:hypothetical protein
MPCFARLFENTLNLLRTQYRIDLAPEETEELEAWLRKRLGITKEEKHEALKEKLELLQRERPNEFRKIEYELIQFVKQLRRNRRVSYETGRDTQKEPKKDEDDKGRKKKRTIAMYT